MSKIASLLIYGCRKELKLIKQEMGSQISLLNLKTKEQL